MRQQVQQVAFGVDQVFPPVQIVTVAPIANREIVRYGFPFFQTLQTAK